MPEHLEPQIEPMKVGHLDQILKIEQACFAQPYTRELFQEELLLDLAHPCILKVGDAIVGFIDYWIVKDEIHLINIAVDPSYRRLALGSFMMKFLVQTALDKNVHKIFLDVRESNVAAIELYKKYDFKKVGVRKRYYSENNEDALVMVRELKN